jgi:hypothetical protein
MNFLVTKLVSDLKVIKYTPEAKFEISIEVIDGLTL